jgi:hypothetical protein
MAELYWNDAGSTLRVKGHHAFKDGAYVGGVAKRGDEHYACLIAGKLYQPTHPCTHPCESVLFTTEKEARQALEDAVWVLLVGYQGVPSELSGSTAIPILFGDSHA